MLQILKYILYFLNINHNLQMFLKQLPIHYGIIEELKNVRFCIKHK